MGEFLTSVCFFVCIILEIENVTEDLVFWKEYIGC